MRLLTPKISLLFFLFFMYGVQADAQIFVANCDHCPTLGLQINTTYNGECGYAFDYSGLIGCDVIGEDWKFGNPTFPSGTASGSNVYFEFPAPGTYPVTLTLTLQDGNLICTKTVTTTVVIDPNDCNQQLISTGGCWRLNNYQVLVYVGPDCEVFAGWDSSPAPWSDWKRTDVTFNWGDGNLFHGNYAGVTHQYECDGTYEICLTITISDGVDICQKRLCRQVTVSGCGPKKKEADLPLLNELSIFPNPVQAGSSVTLRGDLDPSVHEITMMDNQGRIVQHWNISNNAGTNQNFSIPTGVAPGVYFLRSNSAAMPVQKLIVR